MVDWTSQVEIQRGTGMFPYCYLRRSSSYSTLLTVAYANVIFASFGLYIWEVFQTSDFEWSVVEGKRKLKLHMVCRKHSRVVGDLSQCNVPCVQIPFFIARYLIIFSITSLMASFTVKSPINCGALYAFICVAGNLSIICASITLMLRTIAVWERKLPIVATLGTLCLAHCALLFRSMFITSASYSSGGQTCVLTALSNTNRVFLSVTFWATLGFNLTLAVVHILGLMKTGEQLGFGDLLFREGVIYYLAAFTFNAVPAVPATVMTVVSATRIVTRLHDVDDDDDIYVHSATQLTTPRLPNPPPIRFQNKVARYPSRPEVHVTTDRIVMEDYDPSPSSLTDKAASLTGDDKSTFHAV
ncbi:hypothetical protein GSI_00487 [Ganoderma sinense ZZ0214-1]|uniref:Uncharacterized protein n=1 Tax=Ganoderma sinense ZZ0214-1 TaxID=1077348 RepID=A0A2G8SSP7_9APHY|nr:hypothetical protein GSI_00487 [Ganoderma sinense ZZ0214-1]